MIGADLSENFVVLSRNELSVAEAAGAPASEGVTDWERERYCEFC